MSRTTLPLPGIEWPHQCQTSSEAARFGADVSLLGQAVQLLTQGVTIADFRPESADDTVDIRVRFPSGDRTLEALQGLRVPTQTGLIPITNFVSFEPGAAHGRDPAAGSAPHGRRRIRRRAGIARG